MAVRVPSPDWLRELIKKAGALLISTSANLSGQPPLASFDEVYRLFPVELNFSLMAARHRVSNPQQLLT